MDDDKFAAAIYGSLVIFALMGAMLALSGLTTWLLWGWFIVPLGAPPIGFFHALGLACTVSMLTYQNQDEKKAKVNFVARVLVFLVALVCWLLM